ncbi:MAG: hypothetical protein IH881_18805 [Myxococcales bacterium]|nr:hypothetical protein [Myxococcales bacterium]
MKIWTRRPFKRQFDPQFNQEQPERVRKSPAWIVALALAPVLGASGCASLQFDFAKLIGRSAPEASLPGIIEPRVFLGGAALAQKKLRMRRVHADLVHLYRGYEINTRQLKRRDALQLEAFVRPFIDRHVDPLFVTKGQGWNTDLRLLKANLLFAKAALFVAIEESAGLTEVIDTLSGRFRDHESLLIEYPIGETQTLAHGIRDLRIARRSL